MTSTFTTRSLPIAAILIGAGMWGVIWYPLRLLDARGFSGLWLTVFIYGVALLASLPRTAREIPGWASRPRHFVALLLAAGWTNIAFVEAVLNGNILRVVMLFYLSPLWAVLLARLWLGERISALSAISLGIAMAGAMVMLWDPVAGLPLPRDAADWFALSSGIAFAISNIITRETADIPVGAKSAAVWLGVVLVGIAMNLLLHRDWPPVSGATLAYAAALGVCGILVMTVLVQYGVTHLPVQQSAVLALVELVVAAVSQQLLTDEVVSAREWLGGVLIIIGAVLAARAIPAATTGSKEREKC